MSFLSGIPSLFAECSMFACIRCNHFSRLQPGEAGNLSFEHDGEHGGAFEFSLGSERFFLGQHLEGVWIDGLEFIFVAS